MTPRWRARVTAVAGAGAAVALASLGLAAAPWPAGAASFVAISGSGSSWASVAIDQWAQDVRPNGIVVNYNPDGSASGRGDYMANQDEFAGSDPPFRNGLDKLGGTGAEHPSQGYSYIPDTAGGTALIYHITVGGKLITNLRLDPKTIFEIFTGQITNWDNKRITHIYGAQLPNLPITPVVRSDGSGATYFFTLWLSSLYPSEWNRFCGQVHQGISSPCGNTEFYPQFGNAKAENGSNNVATYITASYGEGTIGYDEYAYALNAHYPVVKLRNPGGYYVLPTAQNDAVALTQAIINTNARSADYLQQNLDNVYTYNDPRSYPLSSYSYLIVPRTGTKLPSIFSSESGRSLSTYINYLLCAGQKEMPDLGYSPLPINLVKGGLDQVDKIPGHVATPNRATLGGCENPTFINGQNILLSTAPQPSPCDKVGQPLNCTVVNGRPATTSGSGPGGGTSPGATAGPGANPTPSAGNRAGTINPVTGQVVPGSGNGPISASNVAGQVVPIAGTGADGVLLATLTALEVVGAVAAPPAIGFWLRRRRKAI